MKASLANLRASATPWLALPALLFLCLYVRSRSLGGPPGYGPASGELAVWGLVVIAPTVAAAAAWEAGRHRSLRNLRSVGVRGPLRQVLWAAAPVLVLHLLLAAGALVLARVAAGVWPGGGGLLAAVHLLVLPCGWLVIGWVLGLLCPRAVAAPVAAFGCWTWLAVPPSLNSAWVRHLSGLVLDFSTRTDLLSPLAYLVPWLVTAALAVGAVLLTGARRRPWLVAVSAVLVVGVLAVGRGVVLDWGYSALRAPRAGHTVCAGAAPVICLPQEYAADSDRIRSAALPVLASLRAAGVPSPQVLRMASGRLPPEPGTWPLSWSPAMRGDVFAESLAGSALSGTAAQYGVPDCRLPSVASAWASLAAGRSEAAVRREALPSYWADLQAVRALPAAAQAEWFTGTVRAQKYCAAVRP
ncbi:DUF7224 domain-containing protein [Streptomyces sp. NPDC054838]